MKSVDDILKIHPGSTFKDLCEILANEDLADIARSTNELENLEAAHFELLRTEATDYEEVLILIEEKIRQIYEKKVLILSEIRKKIVQQAPNDFEAFIKAIRGGELTRASGMEGLPFDFEKESPLFIVGYSVSQQRGLTPQQRRHLIDDFIKSPLPTADIPLTVRAQWGEPNSIQRVRKVMSHIRALISQRRNLQGMKIAIDKWESDLRYIQKTYDS